MSILILSGPSAAGKNTITTTLAKRVGRTVVIDVDVDVVRQMATPNLVANAAFVEMVKSGRWPGTEEQFQDDEWKPGARAVFALGRQFADDGFQVIIVDVLTDESARYLREGLIEMVPKIVQLLPSHETMWERFKVRSDAEGYDRLTREEVEAIYSHEARFSGFERLIDNSHLSAQEVANQLAPILERSSRA